MEEKIKRHRRTKAEMLATSNIKSVPVIEAEIDESHKKTGRGRPTKSEMDYKLDDPNRPLIKSDKDAVNAGLKPKIYDITCSDVSVWHYDWNKNPQNGLVSTTTVYPKDFDFSLPDDDALPLTKRQWLNPANGKYVGYGRAVQLGLYTPETEGKGKRGRPKKA